jgi:hypothetical protein
LWKNLFKTPLEDEPKEGKDEKRQILDQFLLISRDIGRRLLINISNVERALQICLWKVASDYSKAVKSGDKNMMEKVDKEKADLMTKLVESKKAQMEAKKRNSSQLVTSPKNYDISSQKIDPIVIITLTEVKKKKFVFEQKRVEPSTESALKLPDFEIKLEIPDSCKESDDQIVVDEIMVQEDIEDVEVSSSKRKKTGKKGTPKQETKQEKKRKNASKGKHCRIS